MNRMQSRVVAMASTLFFGALMLGMQTIVFAQDQDQSEVNQQLARLRAATARYHDVNNAIEDGFVPITGVCHNGLDGFTVGISYVHIPRFRSADVNLEEPEFLNYIPTGDGNVRLVGIAYGNRALFRDTRPPETPGYLPGVFPWLQPVVPAYLQEVSGPYSLFGQDANLVFDGRWLYLLSAWVWAPNPNGMFADGNPSLSCF